MQRAVLSAVQIAGLLAWTLVAPNTLQLLGGSVSNKKSAQNSAVRLMKKGLLKRTSQGLELTAKGKAFLDKAPKTPGRWDGKWRVVMFDIPESRKKSRDSLRMKLRQIGFRKLQNSAWIYPYDCEDLLALLRTDHVLGREVMYMVVEALEESGRLERLFAVRSYRGREDSVPLRS